MLSHEDINHFVQSRAQSLLQEIDARAEKVGVTRDRVLESDPFLQGRMHEINMLLMDWAALNMRAMQRDN